MPEPTTPKTYAEPRPLAGRRLSATERRRQLIGIGLELLTERPLSEITVEEVSRRAGISRGLLFNYFPTRRDFHIAVIRAAMRRMSRIVEPPEDVPERDRVRVVIERAIAFLERRHDPYVAIVRGVAGADPEVCRDLYRGASGACAHHPGRAGAPAEPGVGAARSWLACVR